MVLKINFFCLGDICRYPKRDTKLHSMSRSWKIAMANCFYVTLGRDVWRNCSLCLRKRIKLQTWRTNMFLRKFYHLVRKDVTKFRVKFSHFQYATLEMFKTTLNNYLMLKLRFLINTFTFAMYCKNVPHQYYETNQDSKPHILL